MVGENALHMFFISFLIFLFGIVIDEYFTILLGEVWSVEGKLHCGFCELK